MQLEYYYIQAALNTFLTINRAILPEKLFDEEKKEIDKALDWLQRLATEEWCNPEKRLNKEWLPEDHITIRWHIDDVLSRDESLTKDQARQVLIACVENHNSEQGINWDVIDYWINQVKSYK